MRLSCIFKNPPLSRPLKNYFLVNKNPIISSGVASSLRRDHPFLSRQGQTYAHSNPQSKKANLKFPFLRSLRLMLILSSFRSRQNSLLSASFFWHAFQL